MNNYRKYNLPIDNRITVTRYNIQHLQNNWFQIS